MEKELSILTEKQREAYLLRKEGKTYREIAEKLGCTPSAVRCRIHDAQTRLRQYEQYHAEQEQNNEPADFTLTNGELKAIVTALELLEMRMESKAGSGKLQVQDWRGRLPYEAKIVHDLLKRAREATGGEQLRFW